MDDLFQTADQLGPFKLVHIYEPEIQLKATLVIDNVAAGPAIGGLRMAPDVSTLECFRLARAMTLKSAAAGLPHGGAKSVLYGDPHMPLQQKERLIRHLARALANESNYIFGPDMGTNETCMGWIHDEIGRSVGLPREIGGIPLDEVGATGWGVSHAIEMAAEHCGLKLSGARLAIQGFGAVGQHTARFLAAKGVQLVGVADSKGTVSDPNGLDLDKLIALKQRGKSVTAYDGATPSNSEEIIAVPCDIWVPAARPDAINELNVERLKARIVVEGANIAITPGAEKNLYNHNVLCIPDFIANAGGVICAAMEYQGATQAEAFSAIQEKIRHNTGQMLEAAMRQQQPPREAATAMALERLKRAMELRRCSLF